MVDAMKKGDEESEELQQKYMEKEIDTAAFVQKYKKLRGQYHRRALIHLSAKTSFTGWKLLGCFLKPLCKYKIQFSNWDISENNIIGLQNHSVIWYLKLNRVMFESFFVILHGGDCVLWNLHCTKYDICYNERKNAFWRGMCQILSFLPQIVKPRSLTCNLESKT